MAFRAGLTNVALSLAPLAKNSLSQQRRSYFVPKEPLALSDILIKSVTVDGESPYGHTEKYRMPFMGFMEVGPHGVRNSPAKVVKSSFILKDPMGDHYGQNIFEGMIATFNKHQKVFRIFGLDEHYSRFNASLKQLSMPSVTKEEFHTLIKETLLANVKHFGNAPRVYIRPVAFVNYNHLAPAPHSDNERMVVLVNTIPIGDSYYSNVSSPNKVFLVNATKTGSSISDPILGDFRSPGRAKQGGNCSGHISLRTSAIINGGIDAMYLDIQFPKAEEGSTLHIPTPSLCLGEATSSASLVLTTEGKVQAVLGPSSLESVTQTSLLKLAELDGKNTERGPLPLSSIFSGHITGMLLCGTLAEGVKVDELVAFGKTSFTFSESRSLQNFSQKLTRIKSGLDEDVLKMVTVLPVPDSTVTH